MRTLTARPALRWLVPLAVLLAVLASFLVTSRAKADTPLAPIEAPDLLAKVADAKVDGLTGTVVQKADLGIPPIPGDSDSVGGKLTSLLAGNHSMRVWYGSDDKVRLSVNDQYAETDFFAKGSDLWTYDSRARKATQTTLPSAGQADRKAAPAGAPQTPQDAAKEILAKLTPTTDVRVDPEVTVAQQAAYELVLTPKDPATLVKQVRIAVDGENYLPLRVQVFGSGDPDNAALDISYTDIAFGQPEARMFDFNPPPGTDVTRKVAPERKAPTAAEKKDLQARKAQADKDTVVVGSGWSAVVVTKLPSDAATSNDAVRSYLTNLPKASGTWGTGHVLGSSLVTAILTDDGRLAVGAVSADAVSAALAR